MWDGYKGDSEVSKIKPTQLRLYRQKTYKERNRIYREGKRERKREKRKKIS